MYGGVETPVRKTLLVWLRGMVILLYAGVKKRPPKSFEMDMRWVSGDVLDAVEIISL